MTPYAASAAPVTRIAAAPEPQAQTGPRGRSIPRAGRGHFLTEAPINGQCINLMVDTGASVVAFAESSAARFGPFPSHGDYITNVATANAPSRGAQVSPMVDVGGLVLHDVDAMVLPDEGLSENLPGLSFP